MLAGKHTLSQFLSILFIFFLIIEGLIFTFSVTANGSSKLSAQNIPQDVAADFINIAISDYSWLEGSQSEDWAHDTISLRKNSILQSFSEWPFIYEFLKREKGLPQQAVINKWTNEIRIGISWPKIELKNANTGKIIVADLPGFNPWGNQKIFDREALFREQITALVPLISKITNLPVRFVENDTIFKKTDPYANLLIIPTTLLNSRIWMPIHGGTIEPYFSGGVAFTPTEWGQVDGYFLPDNKNNIQFSVCRINPHFEESIVRAYIAECLIRSLGLPNISNYNGDTMLAAWNDSLNSKILKQAKLEGLQRDPDGGAYVVSSRKLTDEKNYRASELGTTLTPYDIKILSLLYCAKIKPGSNANVLQELIAECND